MPARPFRRRRDGALVVHLEPAEAALLRDLAAQLRGLLDDAETDDPVVGRLFPQAYEDPTEERAEREWRALVGPDLLRQRFAALDALLARLPDADGAPEAVLDAEGEDAWLRALNDLRLALGTRLGVTEDLSDAPEDDARAPARHVYDWLTYLQGMLVDVLLEHPRPAPDPD